MNLHNNSVLILTCLGIIAAHPAQVFAQAPDTTALQQMRQSVMNRFEAIFGAQEDAAVTSPKIDQAWNEYWITAFAQALPSSTKPNVSNGSQLPDEFAQVATRKSLLDQLATGNIEDANTDEERKSVIAIYGIVLATLSADASMFPQTLTKRATHVPPTHGDVFVFQAASQAAVVFESKPALDQAATTSWTALAHAANPIYRLLALRIFKEMTGDDSAKLSFYKEYQAETDATIIAEVIQRLTAVFTSDARDYLNQLAAQLRAASRNDLADQAQSARDSLSKFLTERASQ